MSSTRPSEIELDRLLTLIDDHVDLDHCHEVDERYRRALKCEEVDRPPLIVQPPFGGEIDFPAPWDEFRLCPYRQAFDDPVAMLRNELLNNVVPGVLLGDDNPLAIRNNHGTIQIAAAMGATWQMHEDNYPWIERCPSLARIEELIHDGTPDRSAGVLPRSFDTLEFYHRRLDQYPRCKQAVQISLPDLEGPINTAEQLWGSDIYYACTDHADLLGRLLARVVDVQLLVAEWFREQAVDRLDPVANTQHGYMVPGRLLLRDDSSIMLSPDTYREFILPHHRRFLREVGGGSIHFCGDGQHLIEPMLAVPDLHGVDVGECDRVHINTVYDACRERNVAVTRVTPTRDDLVNGKAQTRYPTGCLFVYEATDLDDAQEVVRAYQSPQR
jgi:hypothetical protein